MKSTNNTSLIKIKTADKENDFAENIINTVREPLLILDKNLRVIKASRSFYNFFKVTSDETIGKLIYDLGNHQWNIPKLRELLETILPEKTTFDDYEVEHDFSAIGKRTMLLNARQIESSAVNENIILLAIEDITERKNSEKVLKDNEVEFSIITENSPNAIFIVDNQGRYKYVNTKAVQLLGYSKEEMLLLTIADISPKDRVEEYYQIFRQTLQEGSSFVEIDLVKKDGSLLSVSLNSLLMPDGFIYANCRDITEQKRSEKLLRESEERFRHSFEYAATGICIVGLDKKFKQFNKAFEEMIGYDEDELKNFTFNDITHPEDLFLGLDKIKKNVG